MFGQNVSSPNNHFDTVNTDDIVSKLVGPVAEVNIVVEGVPCSCLVDSGSQVTTVSKSFYDQYLSAIPCST